MENNNKHCVYTFGRFSPPHTGHLKLINHVISHAFKHKADHFIFASHSHDPKKNPLGYDEKIGFMKKIFPHANVEKSSTVKNPLDAAHHLAKKGYKHITLIAGDDRVHEYKNLLMKYKPEGVDHIEVKSAGQRDPDSEGVEGMSASKMRDHAIKKNFAAFRKGVPNVSHAKELYHAVRRGMKLENFQRHFKALFVVGGPGSGKDFVIKPLIGESGILEFPLDKLHKAISEQQNIMELENYPSLIVNGNADNYDKVMVSKKVLEAMGYDTAMIYVYTSNEISVIRNNDRISRGSKTFTEEVRYEKYSISLQNMRDFNNIFEQFNIFDNSNDFSSVGQIKKQEILTWLHELGLSIGSFYESSVKNTNAAIWLIEEKKKILKEGGNVTVGEHAAEPINVTEKNREHVQGDIHHALSALHDSMHREHGIELFGKNKKALHSGSIFSGSTKHLMNNKISHKEFVQHKPKVGDVDVQIPKEHADKLAAHLKPGKHFGNYEVMGTKKHGTETTALMKHHSGKIHQFDFEHVKYEHDEPTKGEQFAHSSSWEDTKNNIKGAHHKILLNATGGEKYKYSITHGLRSRTDEKDEGEQDPEKISKRLFGHRAEHEKIHSFGGLAELIKKHVPKEQHEGIYNHFKEVMDKKKKIDHSVAYAHLRKTLNIKDIHESVGQPSGIGGMSGGETDKFEPMRQNYPKSKKKKMFVKETKDPTSNPTGNPYMFPNNKKKAKKRQGEKSAIPPGSSFDSRMGMVPSGGVGISVSSFEYPKGTILKEKSFERLRKNLFSIISNIDSE